MVIISKDMYRKYTLTATYVINSHHYLISATESDTREATLFHQLLTPTHLPFLADPMKVQSYISDSQNQNVVNETNSGFQVYYQHNLVQIGLKKGLIPLTSIKGWPLVKILEVITLINIDLAISLKQMESNNKHQQMECLNNCCKFYEPLLMKQESKEWILPFLDPQEKKIHYYDIYYGGMMGRNEDKEGKNYLERTNINRSKVRGQKMETKLLGQEQTFRRYVIWLIYLLNNDNIAQFIIETRHIQADSIDPEALDSKLTHIDSIGDKDIDKYLGKLLRICFERPEEYNIHIFNKQCEVLLEKYQRLKAKEYKADSTVEPQIFYKRSTKNLIHKEDNLQPKTRVSLNQEQKIRLSKSLIDAKKHRTLQQPERPVRRQSMGRLKYSKSEITVNKSTENHSKGARKLKKATIDIFHGSKLDSKQQHQPKMFAQSGNSIFQKTSKNGISSFGKSLNFTKMSSAASNWLNTSLQASEISGKLRTFKKGNNSSIPNTFSASTTPKHSVAKENTPGEAQQKEMIGEEELNRFSKFQNRSKAKGLIYKKNSQESMQYKHQAIHIQQPQKIVQDQFTMTDSNFPEQTQSLKTQNRNQQHKRQIISTLSMAVFEEIAQKPFKNESSHQLQKTNKRQPEVHSPLNLSKKVALKKKDNQNMNNSSQFSKDMPERNLKKEEPSQKMPQKAQGITKKIHKQEAPLVQAKNKNKNNAQDIPKSFEKALQSESKILKNGSILKKSITLSKSQVQKDLPQQKKTMQIIPQSQRTFYLKHYELVLKFCNQHKSVITILPNSSNLTFLINFLYYKTLLEHNQSENNSAYKKLVALIDKKQQKYSEEARQQFSIFRVDNEGLWDKAIQLRHLQQRVSKSMESFMRQEEEITCPKQLQQFLTLTEQACSMIQRQIDELYKYLKNNKAMLINQGNFSILLQLGYMMTVTSILSQQRLKFYKCLQSHSFQALSSCYSFMFKDSQDEYLRDYKNRLKNRELTYLNSQEEYNALQNWAQQFT